MTSRAPDTTQAPGTVRVTLLVQHECDLCDHARQVLHRVAADHPLEITEIATGTTEGRRLVTRHGILFSPGVLLDGQPFSHGRLSERKLRRVLARRA